MNNDERIIELLEELVIWSRFSARDSLKTLLLDVLSDPKHLKAYESTDGRRTQQEVATASGLTQPAVSNLWQKWRGLYIVQDGKNGRPAHLVRPSELGLPQKDA